MKTKQFKYLLFVFIIFSLGVCFSKENVSNDFSKIVLSNYYDKITLGEAVSIAATNNPLIEVARHRISMARANKLTAISYYFPRGHLGGNYTHYGRRTIAEDIEFDTSEYSAALRDIVNGYNQAAVGLRSLATSLINSGLFPPGSDIYKSLQKLQKSHPISASIPDNIVTDITLDEQDVFYSSLRVVQPLFLGGRVYFRHKQAKTGEKMAINRYRQAKIAVVHDTLVTYFLFCHAKNLHSILKDSKERIQAIETLAEDRMKKANPANKNEARAPTEYWRAKVFRLMMSEKAKEAESGIENTVIALRALLGTSPYLKTRFNKIDFKKFNLLEEIVRQAALKRPIDNIDVKYMELAAKALEEGRRATAGNFWPQVYGFFQYDTPNNFDYTTHNKGNWQIGVAFDLPVFSLLENIGKYRKASAEVRAAKAALTATILKTEAEVNQLIYRLDYLNKRLKIMEEAEKSKIERLKTARKLYYLGLNDLKDVLDAQYEAVQVDTQLAVVNYEKACAIVNLAEFFPSIFDELSEKIKLNWP